MLRAGLVAVPMNPRSATGELVRMVADSGARVAMGDASTVAVLRTAVAGVRDALEGADDALRARSVVPSLVVHGAAPEPGEMSWDDLATRGTGTVVTPADRERLAVLLYTSGTSGRPRGVMLSHRALLANIEQVGALDPPVMTADDVVLGLLPLFHVYGLNAVLGQVLARGARLVLVPRFDADETLRAVAEHQVTNLPLAPPVVAAWAGRPDLPARFEHVRLVVCRGGSARRRARRARHRGHRRPRRAGLRTDRDRAGGVVDAGLACPRRGRAESGRRGWLAAAGCRGEGGRRRRRRGER